MNPEAGREAQGALQTIVRYALYRRMKGAECRIRASAVTDRRLRGKCESEAERISTPALPSGKVWSQTVYKSLALDCPIDIESSYVNQASEGGLTLSVPPTQLIFTILA